MLHKQVVDLLPGRAQIFPFQDGPEILDDVRFFPSLVGVDVEEESQSANFVVLARRGIKQTRVTER